MLCIILTLLYAPCAYFLHRRGFALGYSAGRADCASTHSRVFGTIYNQLRDSRNAWRSRYHEAANQVQELRDTPCPDCSDLGTDQHGYLIA